MRKIILILGLSFVLILTLLPLAANKRTGSLKELTQMHLKGGDKLYRRNTPDKKVSESKSCPVYNFKGNSLNDHNDFPDGSMDEMDIRETDFIDSKCFIKIIL